MQLCDLSIDRLAKLTSLSMALLGCLFLLPSLRCDQSPTAAALNVLSLALAALLHLAIKRIQKES